MLLPLSRLAAGITGIAGRLAIGFEFGLGGFLLDGGALCVRGHLCGVRRLLCRDALALDPALLLAFRVASISRCGDRRPSGPAFGHGWIVMGGPLAELGRHGVFRVSGCAQPIAEILVFHPGLEPNLFCLT
jgi:hypothetical protein